MDQWFIIFNNLNIVFRVKTGHTNQWNRYWKNTEDSQIRFMISHRVSVMLVLQLRPLNENLLNSGEQRNAWREWCEKQVFEIGSWFANPRTHQRMRKIDHKARRKSETQQLRRRTRKWAFLLQSRWFASSSFLTPFFVLLLHLHLQPY